jgi:peptidoglycan-associated lipoprotein
VHRKSLLWVALLLLPATLFYGCSKKQPVTAPAAAAAAQTMPASQPPATQIKPAKTPPAAAPQDPLTSRDMAVVNAELRRLGFSPDVYFDFDRSALKDDARSALQRNGSLLRQHDRFDLMIEGNCDERGTSEYNLALGERRASSVKGYLVALGVAANRMHTVSYGSERPVCTAHDESCWSQNRHAHMTIDGNSAHGPVG